MSQRNTQLIVLFWKLLQFVYKLNKTRQNLDIIRDIKPVDGIINGTAFKIPEAVIPNILEAGVFCPILVQMNGAHFFNDI